MPQAKLSLMLSSRSDNSAVRDADGNEMKLAVVRRELKKEIEAETFFGARLLTVWVNEEEVRGYEPTSWEDCVAQAVSCDIFISLFDGSAGWSDEKGNPGIGICHAEFEAAHSASPQKVAVVHMRSAKVSSAADRSFLASLTKANPFKVFAGTAGRQTTKQELVTEVKKTVREMLLRAAHEGTRQFKRSGPNLGQALDWSRLSYQERANAIRAVITGSLEGRPRSTSLPPNAVIEIDGQPTLLVPHAVPGPFGVSMAREMAGQPFLRDHTIIDLIAGKLPNSDEVAGPVHLIGCSKSVTEAQAISLLGFPDATIIVDRFGVYVADELQKIQLCLIAGCSDPSSTKHGIQRFFDWLERSGEQAFLAKRARSRRAIVDAIIAQAR